MKRSHQLRAALILICGSMGMLIYHCLLTYSPSTRLLCSQHEVAYSRPQAPGTFSVTDEYKLKYSKVLPVLSFSQEKRAGSRKVF